MNDADIAARPTGPFLVTWSIDSRRDGLATLFGDLGTALVAARTMAARLGPTIQPPSEWSGVRVEDLELEQVLAVIGWEAPDASPSA